MTNKWSDNECCDNDYLKFTIEDKGWGTPERIKQVMLDREKQLRFNRIVTLFIITGSILLLLLILFIFV